MFIQVFTCVNGVPVTQRSNEKIVIVDMPSKSLSSLSNRPLTICWNVLSRHMDNGHRDFKGIFKISVWLQILREYWRILSRHMDNGERVFKGIFKISVWLQFLRDILTYLVKAYGHWLQIFKGILTNLCVCCGYRGTWQGLLDCYEVLQCVAVCCSV